MTDAKDILVFVEQRNGEVQSSTLELLTAARMLAKATGGAVEALVLGGDPAATAGALGAADRIISLAHPALAAYTPDTAAAAASAAVAARNPAAILFSYSTIGLDLAPMVAARAGLPLVAYCTAITLADGKATATSQIYGGKLAATSEAPLPAVFAIMPGAYAEATGAGAPEVVNVPPPAGLDTPRIRFVAEQKPEAGAFDLTLADKIVCVGRGVGSKDAIDEARDVADAIGAEIAGSRPIIDNGWLPKERQVGKSGRKVKPKLYLALGVSGAPEHLEGMRGADLIIAVNSDAAAPIFGIAHFGATCDMFDLLPELGEKLKAGGAG